MHDRLNLEQNDYQIPNKVSDLWMPNSKKWDTNKIVTLFGQQTLDTLFAASNHFRFWPGHPLLEVSF